MLFADIRGWTTLRRCGRTGGADAGPARVPRRDRRSRAVGSTPPWASWRATASSSSSTIPMEMPDAALRAVRLGCALRDEMAELIAAVAEAWPRPRRRRRDRARLRDLRRGRLRGSLRLRGDRSRDEPRLAARRRGHGRPDPDRAAPPRRGRGARRRGTRWRVHAQGLPSAGPGVRRRGRSRAVSSVRSTRAPNSRDLAPAVAQHLDAALKSRAVPHPPLGGSRRTRVCWVWRSTRGYRPGTSPLCAHRAGGALTGWEPPSRSAASTSSRCRPRCVARTA